MNALDKALPPGASDVFIQAVRSATNRSSSGSAAALIIGVGDRAVGRLKRRCGAGTALDIAYEVPADRTFLARRLRPLPLMLATVALGGSAAALFVSGAPLGSAIEGHLPFGGISFVVAWTVVRWALTIAIISLLFFVYYYVAPNRESPRWQWVTVGSAAGTVIFVLASLGFSF